MRFLQRSVRSLAACAHAHHMEGITSVNYRDAKVSVGQRRLLCSILFLSVFLEEELIGLLACGWLLSDVSEEG